MRLPAIVIHVRLRYFQRHQHLALLANPHGYFQVSAAQKIFAAIRSLVDMRRSLAVH
jgi:hypothetical protein